MVIEDCVIRQCAPAGSNIYVLSFDSPAIASAAKAGQFVNIKPNDSFDPLLRQPFSIYHIAGGTIEIIFNVVGKGTELLSRKKKGDTINVLGPLGNPYSIDDSFHAALLVAGGLGIAPMPLLTSALEAAGKQIYSFIGARSRNMLALDYLNNVHAATDDGSLDFHGACGAMFGGFLCGITDKKS